MVVNFSSTHPTVFFWKRTITVKDKYEAPSMDLVSFLHENLWHENTYVEI